MGVFVKLDLRSDFVCRAFSLGERLVQEGQVQQ
jgi:hypothetical protein